MGSPFPPEPTSTTGGGDEGNDENGFLPEPDDSGSSTNECDTFAQDCPDGEKCMPWANDGGNAWNATRCAPLSPAPRGVGESCRVEGGPTSGVDDCALGAMCWNVDPDTLEGECLGLCTGSIRRPTCVDPNAECILTSDATLAVCFPRCDPLAQDCGEGQGCYGLNGRFTCIPFPEDEAATAGETCEFINACVPGTACSIPEAVPGCEDANGCCTPYCRLGDPSPCLPDQACLPYFDPGQAPPGYEEVGICSVP